MQNLNFRNYFLSEENKATHVMTFMRANPPTVGHERVVNHVQQLAKDLDSGYSVILSHSHDGDKNPLTAEQKLRHAKIAFPGANVLTSSPEQPSLLYHAADLHKKGVKNLHLVVGQDRIKQFEDLLNKYNGQEGPHGYYNFQNIRVHSAGGRDPDAEGIEGVSGTSQRLHARKNNFENFRHGAPSRMSDEQATALMNDIRNANPPEKQEKEKVKKPVKKKSEPFNPGTPVYVEHGSHSKKRKKSIKESVRLSFRELTEKKIAMPYQELLNDENYTDARDATVNHLHGSNDHISKGGSDKVDNILRKDYDGNPHSDHLKKYSDYSWDLNNELFDHHNEGGDPNELPMISDWDHIEGLDNALKHSKTKKPMTVFSGVGFNPGQLASKHPEKKLYMPSYTSTSIDPTIAAKFTKPLKKGSSGESQSHMYDPEGDENQEGADHHILKIDLPKGHHGSYMAGSSSLPEEKEFLLPRQQTMKINPKPEIKEFHDGVVKHRMHIWSATPVTDRKITKIKEEYIGVGDARGLGFATGTPAVNIAGAQNYVAQNTADSDNKNNILGMKGGKEHATTHNLVGFKSFNPMERIGSKKKKLE